MVASTPWRVVLHASMVALALAASLPAAAQNRPSRTQPVAVKPVATAPALPIATGQPLRFFTISDRLAALRAHGAMESGAIPPNGGTSTASPASVSDAGVPRARDLGLRLATPGAFAPETILGTIPFSVPGGDLAEKWHGAMARWAVDEARIAACETGPCASKPAKKWLEIRAGAAKRDGFDRLAYVHTALNHSIAYATDFQIFGAADYWASPLEVVERAGDCEDYALAKYLMLKSLGADVAEMKLVALRENFSGQYHAILAVRFEGEWLFMDNKRGGLTQEKDYADTRAIAIVDDSGQSMLVGVAKDQNALRLSTL